MLPNVCFPMFPVVDYKGFRRSYYDVDEHRIYQTGVDWMVRGILHLILYRIVYYYWTIGPAEVIDPDTLTQYLVTNFLLYLRIRSEEHTSELQSLMRISYAVFCLKKKKKQSNI